MADHYPHRRCKHCGTLRPYWPPPSAVDECPARLREELDKAGALIAAEIDRLQRLVNR